MASAKSAKQKSPQKSRGISWKNENFQLLLEVMKEETILFSLDNAKTPKEKRAAYENVAVKLQNKGKIYYLRFIYTIKTGFLTSMVHIDHHACTLIFCCFGS